VSCADFVGLEERASARDCSCCLRIAAASTTVPAMKKSIILVSALSVVVMALVSCASQPDVDPFRVRTDTKPPAQEAAPAHDNIGGMNL